MYSEDFLFEYPKVLLQIVTEMPECGHQETGPFCKLLLYAPAEYGEASRQDAGCPMATLPISSRSLFSFLPSGPLSNPLVSGTCAGSSGLFFSCLSNRPVLLYLFGTSVVQGVAAGKGAYGGYSDTVLLNRQGKTPLS